jgi:hypothetical protein
VQTAFQRNRNRSTVFHSNCRSLVFIFLLLCGSVCFNKGLSRFIFFSGALEIFSRQVYCPLKFKLTSQYPFSLHIRPVIFFSFTPTHWLDTTGFFDLLTILVLLTIFLRTLVSFPSKICLIFMFPSFFLGHMSLSGVQFSYSTLLEKYLTCFFGETLEDFNEAHLHEVTLNLHTHA